MTDLEFLKKYLDYNPDTGIFRWKIRTNYKVPVGSVAGSLNQTGYRQIFFRKKLTLASHLAWLYTYGAWPKKLLDHVNGNRDDNRINNLREATRSQNKANSKLAKNNTSGFKGVYRSKNNKSWIAMIGFNRNLIYLGTFDTIEEAVQIRQKNFEKLQKEFARHA